jgi:hypothetical protein
MSNLKRDAKRRALASSRALTPKNIVEFSMEKCAEVRRKNQSLNDKAIALKTRPELLSVVFVPPPKPQITTEQNHTNHA